MNTSTYKFTYCFQSEETGKVSGLMDFVGSATGFITACSIAPNSVLGDNLELVCDGRRLPMPYYCVPAECECGRFDMMDGVIMLFCIEMIE